MLVREPKHVVRAALWATMEPLGALVDQGRPLAETVADTVVAATRAAVQEASHSTFVRDAARCFLTPGLQDSTLSVCFRPLPFDPRGHVWAQRAAG